MRSYFVTITLTGCQWSRSESEENGHCGWNNYIFSFLLVLIAQDFGSAVLVFSFKQALNPDSTALLFIPMMSPFHKRLLYLRCSRAFCIKRLSGGVGVRSHAPSSRQQ